MNLKDGFNLKLPENPEFGVGYRTWSKNKAFGFGSRQKHEKVVFWAFFTISFGPDTNIEIILVIFPNTGYYQKLTNAIVF